MNVHGITLFFRSKTKACVNYTLSLSKKVFFSKSRVGLRKAGMAFSRLQKAF